MALINLSTISYIFQAANATEWTKLKAWVDSVNIGPAGINMSRTDNASQRRITLTGVGVVNPNHEVV